jgi:pimeloyl-ACP methyl ester carboxylesterase
VVGWSIGGVIASAYAQRHPARVGKLVLLAPVGAVPCAKPWTAALLHLPLGVGNALAKLVLPSTVKKLYRNELGSRAGDAKVDAMHAFLAHHATANANLVRTMISTLRSCPEIDDNVATSDGGPSAPRRLGSCWMARTPWTDGRWALPLCRYTEIGAHARPVLVVWGTADHTVPDRPDELLRMMPNARLHELEGEAHSFLVTAPEAVNAAVCRFLE